MHPPQRHKLGWPRGRGFGRRRSFDHLYPKERPHTQTCAQAQTQTCKNPHLCSESTGTLSHGHSHQGSLLPTMLSPSPVTEKQTNPDQGTTHSTAGLDSPPVAAARRKKILE